MNSAESEQPAQQVLHIEGVVSGKRVDSRVLEETIQRAIAEGHRNLEVHAFGQHGIGGRIWRAGKERVYIKITGPAGQRIGSMGFPNTTIEVMGPVSDDVGWLNAGAEIIVHGNAGNGAGNAMAQGKIFIKGNIGARGMTMTKHNPRFAPPELWVLGSVGDYFAEFMAGGIAVICGHMPQDPENILGYRPCVGMVGGRIYFRGPYKGHSNADAKLVRISEEDWAWLTSNLPVFLQKIGLPELFTTLTKREEWQLLVALSPHERGKRRISGIKDFRARVWDKELGKGGLIGDLVDFPTTPVEVITTGELRRYVPIWENQRYSPPCMDACPTGIPVHKRWQLIREGRVDEAVDLALSYTPFPATVCGYLCPNLCMKACTRNEKGLAPVDVSSLGRASIVAWPKTLPPVDETKKIAIVGGGPAGLSVAWQLRMKGYNPTIFDADPELGGKISQVIPEARIPREVLEAELKRARQVLPNVLLKRPLNKEDLQGLLNEYAFLVLATGAHRPRTLNIPGKERLIPALEFLKNVKSGNISVGKRLVIIGAGNVGCDVALEAKGLGAEEITLLDIQEPLSFGKERKAAEAAGARFKWPVFVTAVTENGVETRDGEFIEADTVVIAIGDEPDLESLPEGIRVENGFVWVNQIYQTSNPRIFAVGDMVRPGLITEAIGAGRVVAEAIDDIFKGQDPAKCKAKVKPELAVIDKRRVKLEYFNSRPCRIDTIEDWAKECASCGQCKDCGLCIEICPQGAISKVKTQDAFELVVDGERCIGCGFCAGVCPCGVWNLVENEPYEVLASRNRV